MRRLAEVLEDGGDDARVLDVGDDAHAAVAARAGEDVEIEGAAEERCPWHARGVCEGGAVVEALHACGGEDVGDR